MGDNLDCFSLYLTSVHNFSTIIQKKYFSAKEIPPFHPWYIIYLIINTLGAVELWVEYGWNYMKFHPYSTHNSTTRNHLIITMITPLRWKGGITNEKKYFSGKRQENVLMTVKRLHFYGSHLLLGNRKIRLFLVKSVLTRQYSSP